MNKDEFLNYVKEPVAADGAWGTELLKAGLTQGDAPELWNLEAPEKVQAVASSYAQAGSRIILTNSFGASSIKLSAHGLEDKAAEINRAAAKLTAGAGGAEKKHLTCGDMGPCGKMVFMGEVSEEEVEASYGEQAQALKEGGADILLLETFTDLTEASAALKGALKVELPVVVTFTYDRMADGSYRTVMGHSPEDVIPVLTEIGASAIGANCGAGVDQYVELSGILCELSTLPVWIKANAGLPVLEDGKVVYPMGAEEYATHIPALLEAGVKIIGGCCGTNPDHIRGIVREIEAFKG